MAITYYLETHSQDPSYNLAFEEFVQAHRREGNYLILWQNKNAVIIGRNQNAEAEIHRDFVERHGISVIRRNTGGGAVYHDLGNLNYSFITDAGDVSQRSAAFFTGPVVTALQKLGLDACASGRNDILVSGCKISGTAQHLMNGRILHHGTLLFDSDLSVVAGALNPDPTKFQSKSVKSVRSRVGNIRGFLKEDMTLPQFWDFLKTALADTVVPTVLTGKELAEVRKLQASKYATWQWNYGKSPQYATVCRRRFPGGLLEIHMTVRQGIVTELRIFGDFLALTPVKPLEDALIGCAYREEALDKALEGVSDFDCLGCITRGELMDTLLQRNEEA